MLIINKGHWVRQHREPLTQLAETSTSFLEGAGCLSTQAWSPLPISASLILTSSAGLSFSDSPSGKPSSGRHS